MQIDGNSEGFPLKCIVWVGNIMTPFLHNPNFHQLGWETPSLWLACFPQRSNSARMGGEVRSKRSWSVGVTSLHFTGYKWETRNQRSPGKMRFFFGTAQVCKVKSSTILQSQLH